MRKTALHIIIFLAVFLAASSAFTSSAQNKNRKDRVTEMEIKPGVQFDTVTVIRPTHKPEHLLGIRYDYSFCNVTMTPDLKPEGIGTPLNLSILYTYYQPKWATLDFFGVQTGFRYTQFGFKNGEYQYPNFEQTVTSFEYLLLSAFHYDIKEQFRVLFSIGPYAGYRAFTTKDNGFDCYDIRFDYGIEGGLGFAYRLKDFMEFHVEGVFKYAFSMLYHPEKFSSISWVYTYPWQLSICLGIHFRLK